MLWSLQHGLDLQPLNLTQVSKIRSYWTHRWICFTHCLSGFILLLLHAYGWYQVGQSFTVLARRKLSHSAMLLVLLIRDITIIPTRFDFHDYNQGCWHKQRKIETFHWNLDEPVILCRVHLALTQCLCRIQMCLVIHCLCFLLQESRVKQVMKCLVCFSYGCVTIRSQWSSTCCWDCRPQYWGFVWVVWEGMNVLVDPAGRVLGSVLQKAKLCKDLGFLFSYTNG